MKILHECRATHVLSAISDVAVYDDIHLFHFIPTNRQGQVKLDQTSEFKTLIKNIPFLSTFFSGFHKCHLFFRMTITKPKKRFKKVASPFPDS